MGGYEQIAIATRLATTPRFPALLHP